MSVEKLNNQEILLMYVSNELTHEQRAEFERELARDQSLQNQLAELSAAQEVVAGAIAQVDAASALPLHEGAAVRRVSRAIQQWQVDRARHPVTTTVRFWNRSYPRWAYASATAAMVLIGFLVYWGFKSDNPAGEEDPAQQAIVADKLQQSFESNDSIVTLARAEGEAASLSANPSSSDDDTAQ